MDDVAKNFSPPHVMTEERKELFLEALRKTASLTAAARIASPWCKGLRGGLNTFRDLIARNAEFAAAVEEALGYALGRAEEKIMELAVDGLSDPIFQGGVLVGHRKVHDAKLLLRLLERLDRRWASQEHVQVEGKFGVVVVGAPAQSSDDWSSKVANRVIDVTPGDSQSNLPPNPTPPVPPPSDPTPPAQ